MKHPTAAHRRRCFFSLPTAVCALRPPPSPVLFSTTIIAPLASCIRAVTQAFITASVKPPVHPPAVLMYRSLQFTLHYPRVHHGSTKCDLQASRWTCYSFSKAPAWLRSYKCLHTAKKAGGEASLVVAKATGVLAASDRLSCSLHDILRRAYTSLQISKRWSASGAQSKHAAWAFTRRRCTSLLPSCPRSLRA